MRRTTSLGTLLLTAVASLTTTGCYPMLWPSEDKLDEVAGALETHLDTLDTDLANAATEIAQTGLDGDATRSTLAALAAEYPTVADVSTISPEGIIVAVEPEEYRGAEGADISDQTQVIAVLQDQQPVMSALFTAVEGFPALDFEYPLLLDSESVGSVSMLIKPADYFAEIIAPLIEGTGYLCMVVQTDGVILYDVDLDQIGRDTFSDPLYADYPELLAFAESYLATREGTGTYSFLSSQTGQTVRKYARWTTVEFHGTQWRVLLIREGSSLTGW